MEIKKNVVFSILALTMSLMSCNEGVSSNSRDILTPDNPSPGVPDNPSPGVPDNPSPGVPDDSSPKTPVTGMFAYSPISVTRGQVESRLPDWNDAPPEQTVTYAIDPSLPEGMSIDTKTGEIEVEATTGVQSETKYTITATGTGTYEGSNLSTVLITVEDGFVLVEGGVFTMGSPPDEPDRETDEGPQYSVGVVPFYMSKHEVTQALYESIMKTNPSINKLDGTNKPVELVTWYEAVVFCNALSEHDGLESVYTITGGDGDRTVVMDKTKNGYRLPTEEEWEYAARGGNKSEKSLYSGSDDVGVVAWYKGNSDGTTHVVGGKTPNELGLYDMSGNVQEWCWDEYKDSYDDERVTYRGGRVARGGSYNSHITSYLRVASRGYYPPIFYQSNLGLRLVLRTH